MTQLATVAAIVIALVTSRRRPGAPRPTETT